jgi:hypothetical protein
MRTIFFLIAVWSFGVPLAFAQSAKDMNTSNNPISPIAAFNVQDYDMPSFYDSDNKANTLLLRAATPTKLGGLPQIVRATLPYSAVPSMNGDTVRGWGDFNIFDIFLAGNEEMQYGVGPYLVVPTAYQDETGTGKWQIGLASTVIRPNSWGLMGALATYQHDFAGDTDRPTQNIFTAQPLLIYNLPQAFYLRSSAIWNFDWQTGNYCIPVGFGAGKLWKISGGEMINASIEPQWTVSHEGPAPQFQTYFALNFQFPML